MRNFESVPLFMTDNINNINGCILTAQSLTSKRVTANINNNYLQIRESTSYFILLLISLFIFNFETVLFDITSTKVRLKAQNYDQNNYFLPNPGGFYVHPASGYYLSLSSACAQCMLSVKEPTSWQQCNMTLTL